MDQSIKILLTGANGLLGQAVRAELESSGHIVYAAGRQFPIGMEPSHWTPIDLLNEDAVYEKVTRINPDWIIHCAALSNVDQCEKEPDLAYQVNGLTTKHLARACQKFDTALMYISTDYVFDGLTPPPEGYSEFDPVHPLSIYGKSKLWGETLLHQHLSRFSIVRTSWLFGPGRQTFVDSVIRAGQTGTPIPCVKDMISAPTSVIDLSQGIRKLIESNRFGTYHLTNEGACSRVELAEFVLSEVGLSQHVIQKTTQKELALPAMRPKNSKMRNWMWNLSEQPRVEWTKAIRSYLKSRAMIHEK